jgi:hypothetical protein
MDENRERVNGLEAAAIHHHRPASDQADRAAQDHELVTNSPYRLAVVLGEIGNGLANQARVFPSATCVRHCAPASCSSPTGLHSVQIAVEIELEYCRVAIPGSPGRSRPGEAKGS